MSNYMEMKTMLKRNCRFAYIDDVSFASKSLLFKHRVALRNVEVASKPGEKYVIVIVTVNRRDREKFITAVNELPGKMLLIGNVDYEDKAKRLIDYLTGAAEEYVG